jgi:hypothetical protein
MRKLISYTIIASALIPALTFAYTSSPPASQNTPAVFNVTGYLDGSYSRLVRNQFTSGTFDRAFDVVPNGLTLHQAAITLAYQLQGLGGLLNLIAGQDAQFIAPYGFKPTTEFDSETIAVDFTQAYIQYARTPTTFIIGGFLSTNGNESLNPTLDTNFSRSLLYYMTPLYFYGDPRIIYGY